jgi:hypothetical protein
MKGDLNFETTYESVEVAPGKVLVLQEYYEDISDEYGQYLFNISLEEDQDEPHPELGCSHTITTDLWEGYDLNQALKLFEAFKYFYQAVVSGLIKEITNLEDNND